MGKKILIILICMYLWGMSEDQIVEFGLGSTCVVGPRQQRCDLGSCGSDQLWTLHCLIHRYLMVITVGSTPNRRELVLTGECCFGGLGHKSVCALTCHPYWALRIWSW